MKRRRFIRPNRLKNDLPKKAKRLREEARLLQPGAVRDELIRRARQAETGSHMSEWLQSPGLDHRNEWVSRLLDRSGRSHPIPC
jgi:hypothetical protein